MYIDQRRQLCFNGHLPGNKKLKILLIKGELRFGNLFLHFCFSFSTFLLKRESFNVIRNKIHKTFLGFEIFNFFHKS